MNIRLEDAQQNVAGLERAIRGAREEFGDWPPEALAAYLAPLVEELEHLRAEIDTALDLPNLRERPEFLWLTMKGGKIGRGRAPASAIGGVLEAVQKGIRQLAAFLEVGAAVTFRLPNEIADEATLDLVVYAPGSAKMALAPAIPQGRIDLPDALADHALSLLTSTLRWAEEDGSEEQIEVMLPDATLRRQIMSRVREIAPSDRAPYESIEVSGYRVREVAGVPRLTVTPRAFNRSSSYLQSRAREEVRYQGQLVLIDIEKDVFDLRHGPFRIHCHVPDQLLDTAKDLIEAYVQVEGEGRFRIDSEVAYRVDVRTLRRLRPEEQARI